MTLSWLLIVTVLAAALAIVDGIRRVRGHRSNSILAIAELVLAVLMLISVFVAFPAPLGTFLFSLALEIVLIILLVLRSTRGRGGVTTVTVIALILNTIVLFIALGWLSIPGLG